MKCPACGDATHILHTRRGVNRRRECTSCGERFSTVEVLVAEDRERTSLLASALIRLRVMRPALRDLLEDLDKLS